MKNKIYLISLMILPIVLFIAEIILKHSKGEYFLYNNYDGQYGYLMASLNVAQFLKPGYTQHPGIVPQIIMAITIKLTHMFQGNDPNIVIDTFNRPEYYLHQINIIITTLSVISLYVLGYVTYKKTGSIFAALFLQFTPFISTMNIYELTLNIPESILFILLILFISITISYLYNDELSEKKIRIYVLLYGLVCGLILATKISVLPVMIIPFLILKKYRNKFYFILISLFVFFFLFVSVSPDIFRIWKFLFGNIVSSDKYGTGSSTFIDVNNILPRLLNLQKEFLLFTIIYFLSFITLALQFIPKLKEKIRKNKYFLILLGSFIIMNFFILLVIKQREAYYVMPGLFFSVLSLFSINSIFNDLIPKFFKFSRYLYIYIIFITFSIPQILSFENYYSFFAKRKYESYKILEHIKENYSQYFMISSDRAASLPTAFHNGLNYTGNQTKRYFSILREKFPDYAYFQNWRKEFIYLNYDKNLKNKLLNLDTLVFHSFNDSNFEAFKSEIMNLTNKHNSTFEEVFANKNGEKLYLVNLKK